MMLFLLACATKSDGEDSDVGVGDSSDSQTEPLPACLPTDRRETLSDYLSALTLVAYGSPAAASADHVVGFYQLPGIAAQTWITVVLDAPCTRATDLDAVCTGGGCYQPECTGVGGGWIDHIVNDDDPAGTDVTDFDGWRVERGRMPLAWAEGAAVLTVEFDIKALTAPDGTDWTFSGTGTFDGQLSLLQSYVGIHESGPVELSITDDLGTVTLAGMVIAEWDGAGLTNTAACE